MRQRIRNCTVYVSEVAPGKYDAQFRGSVSVSEIMDGVIRAGLRVMTGQPPNPPWKPLERCYPDPASMPGECDPRSTHWQNDLYWIEQTEIDDGWTHLSIKRQDKTRVREWRHLQQIKNELCGPEREAMEIFPAESRLVDQADQYHLWVMPEGKMLAVGFADRSVGTPEAAAEWNRKHRVITDQSEWPEGLTTGRSPA